MIFRLGFGHGIHHHGVFHWLVLLILVALVIAGGIALLRTWRGPRSRTQAGQGWTRPGPTIDPALSEVRVRYARGEIGWEEYAQRCANLGYPVTASAPPDPGPMPQPPAR
ncbi:MAG: hypothetical protein ABSG36_14580 [Acidimicrobiales bacterium]|jgi:uncharacterized membrane protein